MKNYWTDKNVVVTGGNGFLGKYVVNKIVQHNPSHVFVPSSKEFDLRKYEDCLAAFKNADIIISLAANVGGIGYNQKHPAELFDDNILISINSLRAARETKIKKFVAIGTICEYPKLAPIPFRESDLWNGYPEETNAPYGMAKKMLLVQTKAYYDQYKFKSINLLPVNLYGPGDNFDTESSHVIPALINKFITAKYNKKTIVEVWGSGKATREFLYVDDAANGIIASIPKVDNPEPINLGSGMEISIKKLAQIIKKEVGFKGKIIWNKNMPDGQPKRKLNISRAKKLFKFEAKVKFEEGIKNTINWYEPIWKKENGIS